MASGMKVDEKLLKSVGERLAGKHHIHWLLGASCTGKTAVCKCLASQGIAVCDMDSRIFGTYLEQYSESRHPASCAWLKRDDAMQWALSLSWEEFNSLNEATNVEILDLFADELQNWPQTQPLVVEGGLSHPYLPARVLPAANLLYLTRDEDARAATWESDENKLQMKNMVLGLPDGRKMWNTFRHFDKMIAETMDDQCRKAGIRFVECAEKPSMNRLASSIVRLWSL
jgi:hypothetical protein